MQIVKFVPSMYKGKEKCMEQCTESRDNEAQKQSLWGMQWRALAGSPCFTVCLTAPVTECENHAWPRRVYAKRNANKEKAIDVQHIGDFWGKRVPRHVQRVRLDVDCRSRRKRGSSACRGAITYVFDHSCCRILGSLRETYRNNSGKQVWKVVRKESCMIQLQPRHAGRTCGGLVSCK
jgi:hypothetical protein